MKNDTLVCVDGLYIIYHSLFRTVRIWSYKNKEEAKQYIEPQSTGSITNLLDSKTFKSGLNMSIMHTMQIINDIVSRALPQYSGLEPSSFATQLFMVDDRTKNGFRKKIYPEYKESRKTIQQQYNFDVFAIRNYILNYLLDEINIWDKMNYTRVFVDNAEADDIIYVVMTEYADKYMNKILIASDQDLLQIPDIIQYNLQGKLILPKDSKENLMTPKEFLLRKIIMGDTSDNIPSILPRYGKVKAEKLIKNKNEFKKILSENKEAFQRFKLNHQLMDISKMPTELYDNILVELKTAFDKTSVSYDLDALFDSSFNKPI